MKAISNLLSKTTSQIGRNAGLMAFFGLACFTAKPAFALEAISQKACEMTVRREAGTHPRIDLRVGSRKISILGWDHLSPFQSEINARDQLFEAALSATDFNKCREAETHLSALSLLLSDEVTRGTQLWKDLKDVEDEFHIDAIGLELTPQEQVQYLVKNAYKADGFNSILKRCPLNTRSMANPLRFVMPGPVYLFESQSTKKPRLEFLEDPAIKARAIAVFQEMNALMPLQSSTLPEAAQDKLAEFNDKIASGSSLADEDVNAFIKEFGDSPAGAKVGKYLKGLKRLLELSPLRNDAIAKNVLAGTGNYAITIGRSHVADLAQKILQRCQVQIGKFK